jgi:hypothetical protein
VSADADQRRGSQSKMLTDLSAVCTGNAPSAIPTARPTAAISYVTNPYFSFPYAETSFDDSRACSSAVSACSRNYQVCVQNLEGGGGFGVTIEVPGDGGTTVGGGGSSLGASATSVCSSLSSEACSGVDPTQCREFSSGGDDDSAADKAAISKRALLLFAAAFAVAIGGLR